MKPTRRSSLFLMELMLAILLFSLAAAICVQVFVKSHMISERSTNLNHAVLASTSVAEIFRSNADSAEILSREYPFSETKDDITYIYYDKNWAPTNSADACYILSIELGQEYHLLVENISVYEASAYENKTKDAPIYTLEVKKYMTEEVVSE